MTEKVKAWLESTGAAFEMAVARTLLGHDLGIQQSHYYADPDDPATSREIDVIASAGLGFGDNATLDLFAVFECKYARTPWVVYRSPPHYSGSAPHFDRIATPAGEKWLDRARAMNSISEGSLWQREPRPGYGLGTSHPDGQGDNSGAVDQPYRLCLGSRRHRSRWPSLFKATSSVSPRFSRSLPFAVRSSRRGWRTATSSSARFRARRCTGATHRTSSGGF